MSRVAIITDSNSGITQNEAKELGIFVIPMPFYIDGKLYFEDIDLTQEQFYDELAKNVEISTSQPAAGDILDLWEKVLKDYDQIVHIPMSSGLSGSCQSAQMFAADYEGKVFVVNNQRISVTQKLSVYEALQMAENGMDALEIKNVLEEKKFDSSIYITLDTLKYLKKGGRITPAAAALGTLLKIKPVLQIQGEKLDAYAKVRGIKQAKAAMLNAVQKDCKERFEAEESLDTIILMMAYTGEKSEINLFHKEVEAIYPNHKVIVDPLSLSVSCHIGPGAVALACARKLPTVEYSRFN